MLKSGIGTIIVIIVWAGLALGSDVLPFGVYDLDWEHNRFTEQEIQLLADTLGINVIVQGNLYLPSQVMMLGNNGIHVYKTAHQPGGSPSLDPIGKYSHYNYIKIYAADTCSQVKLYNCGGYYENGWWVAERGDSTSQLFGPNGFVPNHAPCYDWACNPDPQHDLKCFFIELERKYIWTSGKTEVIRYYTDLEMKIDSINPNPNDTVAYIRLVCEDWDCAAVDSPILKTVLASDFAAENSPKIFDGILFSLPESMPCNYQIDGRDTVKTLKSSNYSTAIVIQTSGRRQLSVNWIKIYDQVGKEIVESSTRDEEIMNYARMFYSSGDGLSGWSTRDEPFALNYQVAGQLLNKIRNVNPNWNMQAAINKRHLHRYWFGVIDNAMITPDIYPFTCIVDCSSGEVTRSVSYTGYSHARDSMFYVQNRLNAYANDCKEFREVAADSGKECWVIAQAFDGHDYAGSKCGYWNCWRPMNGAELSAETFIALACGAKGVIYWKYDHTYTDLYYFNGIRDDNFDRSPLWYAIRDDINPYIKAIDEIYMGLTWDRSFSVNPQNPIVPNGSMISTITAISQTTNSNPDRGWFQIGEYHDTSGAKYFMLVNRACSRGINDTAEAPPVTVAVRFNPNILGSNYALIIDIANSVYHDTIKNTWNPVPKVTYSDKLFGSIQFNVTLRAGEGRLFKVVPISRAEYLRNRY